MRHVARVYTFAALRDVYWREGQGEIGTRKEGSTHSAPGMFRETDSHFKGRAGAFLGEGKRGERERKRAGSSSRVTGAPPVFVRT